ncbi:flagellar hook-associated protein 2 [Spirochaetia bacterium]|nr:flagellar hook-associated protein 2 [Spirochaetia bacterium]
MSDIYVPGVKSRFNTEKLIEDLMKVERVPKDRAEQNIERLETNKSYWQDIGRRFTTLRESARLLYSFQNPFNDRIVRSSDEGAITGIATREAVEQERTFTVKQVAQADRFLSSPLDDSYRVEEGNYRFTVGEDEISFNFRGGSLRDFIEVLNRRGKDKIQASLITVKQGTKSLLIESKITGEGQGLGFTGDAEKLAVQSGMMERLSESRREVPLSTSTVKELSGSPGQSFLSFGKNTLTVGAEGAATTAIAPGLRSSPALVLKFETSTKLLENTDDIPQPPPGPEIPPPGSISYGGVTIENDPSAVPIPPWETPPVPPRVDDMGVISLTFSDGTTGIVPPLEDSHSFVASQYRLDDIAHGKTIVSVDFINRNTHRDVSIRNVEIFDPNARGGLKPSNAVSNAQDAIITMEGIEIRRPSNTIDDLIPGVTLTARSPSDYPIRLGVEPDREGVKDAIIGLVGNYNRLMAEINVLTRSDDKLIQELTYLTADEQDALKKKLGAFTGDSSLSQVKNNLQRAATSPYPTSLDRDLAVLAQIGIGTDVRRSGGSTGYDPSRLRGYMEIDEKILDTALQTKLPAIAQLFGYDTDGDLIVDSGLAFAIENLSKPYVESGGIIAMKTGTVDSQITQEERKIQTLDRQLAAKEAALKSQYGQMEGAYNRMDRMSTSLDQFSRQNSGNNGR